MQGDDGNVILDECCEETAQTAVRPQGLHLPLVPADIHERMMGYDELAALGLGLRRHGVRHVQGQEGIGHLCRRISQQQSHIVPIHGQLPGSQGEESGFNCLYRWHVATPPAE